MQDNRWWLDETFWLGFILFFISFGTWWLIAMPTFAVGLYFMFKAVFLRPEINVDKSG